MQMDLSFSMASINEAPDIVKLVNSAYRGESSKKGWTTEADILEGQRTDYESILSIIESPSSAIIIAKNQSQQVIASCEIQIKTNNYSMNFAIDDNEKVLYFGMFTVSPEYQNKGIGKKVLDHIELLAKKWNIHKIQMTVITLRTELIDFYLRRGFSKLPHFIEFPQDPKFGIPKVTDLKMVVLEKPL